MRTRAEGVQVSRAAAVTRYRQTVLTAFQAIKNQLSSSRSLDEQAAEQGFCGTCGEPAQRSGLASPNAHSK